MTYNLNLIPGKVPVAVHVKQYDTAPREVTFNLYYGDAVYTIPSNVTITVSGTKPDGNGFAYNVTDFYGSTVTVPMEEQMTVLAGEIPCQLTIAQTSGVIGTATFALCVEPAALSSDTPVSDTELAAFQQMLTQTQQEAAGVAGATAQIATNASNIAANTAAIGQLNSKIDYGLYLTVNSFTHLNCTGTPSGTLYFKATNNGRWVYVAGRVNIPDYARTSGNPGISFTLPNGVPTPTGTGSIPVGINSIFPREMLNLATTAGSRTVTITTTESYSNMTGSVLTYILPGMFFYVP